jgi:hypothetical protein
MSEQWVSSRCRSILCRGAQQGCFCVKAAEGNPSMDTRLAAWRGPAILLSSLAQDLHDLIPFQSR